MKQLGRPRWVIHFVGMDLKNDDDKVQITKKTDNHSKNKYPSYTFYYYFQTG